MAGDRADGNGLGSLSRNELARLFRSVHGSPAHRNRMTLDLFIYGVFFLLIALIGWRLRQRRGRIGPAAVGSMYDVLNEDRRKAVEIIVEEKTGERDLEHVDDIVKPEGQ